MYEFNEKDLPFIRTRRALLVLDVQNDFLAKDCLLPVDNPTGFIENIRKLAPQFRPKGYVLWIQTIFEASRAVNKSHGNSEKVITDDEVVKLRARPSTKALYDKKIDDILKDGGDERLEQDSETYLTIEAGQDPQVVLKSSTGSDFFRDGLGTAMDKEKDQFIQKSHYSAFRDGTLVQSLRGKFVTEIYICGVLTNISVFATAIEAARHGYAITIVQDCLGYRDKERHGESLRQLVNLTGCDVMNSKELIQEIQQKEKASSQEKAPKTPKALKPPSSPSISTRSHSNLESAMSNLKLKDPEPMRPKAELSGLSHIPERKSTRNLLSELHGEDALTPESTEVEGRKPPDRVKSKIKTRRRNSHSGPKDSSSSKKPETPLPTQKDVQLSGSTSQAKLTETRKAPEKFATKNRPMSPEVDTLIPSKKDKASPPSFVLEETELARGKKASDDDETSSSASDIYVERRVRPSETGSAPLCEGDTTIINNVVPDEHSVNLFEKVRDEVLWQKMSHQGGDVPRLVSVQGEVAEDGSIPIYRHPSDESPPLLPFSPNVSLIRKHVEEILGHNVNHVLIQYYRDGKDYISEHSDKTLDILPKTFIANVSLGAQRNMVFRTKRPRDVSDEKSGRPREMCRAPLPHNSMCRMGPETNMKWLHGIRQDKRKAREKTDAELASDGGRTSLTFRKIGTFLHSEHHKIWGQGATAKSKETAKSTINGETPEARKMLLAFGTENQSTVFDWKATYGLGFDVLHISNRRKLFLSGDTTANLRVKLTLAEYGIEWTEGSPPPFKWKDYDPKTNSVSGAEELPIKFVDNDPSRSTVSGDTAIMLYLDAIYGKEEMSEKPRAELARQYTRFQQADQLLEAWRANPFGVQQLRREAYSWLTYATQSEYIAGDTISLADLALFPVLLEVAKDWELTEDFEVMSAYWKRMRDRESVVMVLGPETEKERPIARSVQPSKSPNPDTISTG